MADFCNGANDLEDDLVGGYCWDPVRVDARFSYLYECLQRFSGANLDLICNYDVNNQWGFNDKIAKFIVNRINQTYWANLEQHVKPAMSKKSVRVDVHKIIAGTEFAIMKNMLLVNRSDSMSGISIYTSEYLRNPAVRQVNARFALFVSISMLENWMEDKEKVQFSLEKRLAVQEEHVKWLMEQTHRDIKRFQVFLDSQFWYGIEEVCKLEEEVRKLECEMRKGAAGK